jgi:hypothetical protein
VCQGQASSTEEDEYCSTSIVSIRRRLKRKRPESKEAKWESIRRNEWPREQLTSISEEEEEPEEKQARTDKEKPSRFDESARWLAEADPMRWAELARRPVEPC